MFSLKMLFRLIRIMTLIFIISNFISINEGSAQRTQSGNPRSQTSEVKHGKGNSRTQASEVQRGKSNSRSQASEVLHGKGNSRSQASEVLRGKSNSRSQASEVLHGKGNPRSQVSEVQHGQGNQRSKVLDVQQENWGNPARPEGVQVIALGGFFEQNSDEIQEAFEFALGQFSRLVNKSRYDFQLSVDVINTADAFKLSRLICNHFGRGEVSLMGAVTPDSFDTLHSYTNTFQVPFMTPWFPEKVLPTTSGMTDFATSLRPDYHKAVIDIINHYGWKSIIYIYDSHDGLLRLQQLYQSFQPGKATFQISHVKKVTNATEVISFLNSLESIDRWSNKYVVLDSRTELAQETLILHVRQVQLGRRNYHYFLSGLVMDGHWDKNTEEYGVINVTGFRVLDVSKKKVQNFFDLWRRRSISAQAALMYDTVQVLIDAIVRVIRKRNDFFVRKTHTNTSNLKECNPHSQIAPFEYGERLARFIKRTEVEGLTGSIRFTDRGHRINFTLQVIEMNQKREFVKIGTWYDDMGFILVGEKFPKLLKIKEMLEYDRNHTYIISTITESPYVFQVKSYVEQVLILQGFCLDLTSLIMNKLELKYQVRIVKDKKYGSKNPKVVGGWDGIIGELVRKEVDLAIAPLTVSLDRESVVDFSKPFLSFDVASRNDFLDLKTMFTFLRPLSMELWLSILGSFLGVSLSLFIVSRFSPSEWRIVTVTESRTNNENEVATTRTTVVNEFSLWNSMWFSLGSLMQQGSDITPRSISGRIVTFVWWIFALILVSMYTANMATYLTMTRISEPLLTYSRVTACPGDEIPRKEADGIWTRFLSAPGYPTNKNHCEMLISVTQSGIKDFAIAFPKGSKLRDGVNLALQALREEGELQNLVRKWFVDTKCNADAEIYGTELTLTQLSGAFFILFFGLVLALLVGFCEFLFAGCSKARAANISLRQALIARALRPEQDATPSPSGTNQEPQEDQDNSDWNEGAYGEYFSSNNSIQEEPELHESFTPT